MSRCFFCLFSITHSYWIMTNDWWHFCKKKKKKKRKKFCCCFLTKKKKKKTTVSIIFFFPSSFSPSLLLFEKKKVLLRTHHHHHHHHHHHDASSDQNRPTPRETTTTPREQTEEERAGGLRVRRRVRGVRRRRCVPLVFFVIGENWISSSSKNKRMRRRESRFWKLFRCRVAFLSRALSASEWPKDLSLSLHPYFYTNRRVDERKRGKRRRGAVGGRLGRHGSGRFQDALERRAEKECRVATTPTKVKWNSFQ